MHQVNKKLQDIQDELRSDRLDVNGRDPERISVELKSALSERKDTIPPGAYDTRSSDFRSKEVFCRIYF